MDILRNRLETKDTFVHLCWTCWTTAQDGKIITLRLCGKKALVLSWDTCYLLVITGFQDGTGIFQSPPASNSGIYPHSWLSYTGT